MLHNPKGFEVILAKDGVKRRLFAPFKMCMHASDIRALALELTNVADRWEKEGVSYGWFDVSYTDAGAPNTIPKEWAE